MRVLGVLKERAMSAAGERKGATGAVHVAIMRTVRPGREREFEALIQEFFREAALAPGVCGAYLIRPFASSHAREYGILRSFVSEADRGRFYGSDLYRRWSDAVAPLVEGGSQMRALHGMEAFFRDGESPPPAWKMASVTWIGVMPAVYIFSNAVPAVFGTVPEAASLVLVNVFVVASLTWFFMPILTKLFRRWLSGPAQ
jgi:hypothetical protein